MKVCMTSFCVNLWQGEIDPYAAAKEAGIFRAIKSPRNMTTSTIIRRILANHEAYKVSSDFVYWEMILVATFRDLGYV